MGDREIAHLTPEEEDRLDCTIFVSNLSIQVNKLI